MNIEGRHVRVETKDGGTSSALNLPHNILPARLAIAIEVHFDENVIV
jgi:hypothetical protein